jgi:Ca2+-binding EF-hand superfamily protein
VEAIIKQYDSDNNGTIEFQEFLIPFAAAKSIFNKLDKNSDGIIDVDDISESLKVELALNAFILR